mmetsp:Transcript_35147/g.81016  ORF Transcript_35147/g.81016 Transcript_35147/m.81016 type:complete len:349 (-) Transcript_35147:43-1089(-)
MIRPNQCWPSNHAEAYCCREWARGLLVSQCFSAVYSPEVCCLGKASPFSFWPVDIAILGYPGTGTTSMIRTLEQHPNVTIVRFDSRGKRWKGTEMQAMDHLIATATRSRILQFGRSMVRGHRSPSRRLMSDPTIVFNPDKTWAMSQIRTAKFVVLVRDPLSWLASQICKTPCTSDHKQLGLCYRNTKAVMKAGGPQVWRAPLLTWLQVCLGEQTWWPCTDYSLGSPYFSDTLESLLTTVEPQSRVALVSLEGLQTTPMRTMRALYTFLDLDQAHVQMPASFAIHNVNASTHVCRDAMQNDPKLSVFFSNERQNLARKLQKFSPARLLLPLFWRRFLEPAVNESRVVRN